MDFSTALRENGKRTYTENGARAKNTSSDALVDMFASIGSLRSRTPVEITRIFAEAYKEDPLIATKIAFYARDARGGLGERRVFREIIKYMAQYHPEAIKPNLDLIGVYGRYDDLYVLIGTPIEADMWATMKAQFEEDRKNLAEGKAVSLLGKWIKTPDASSVNTRTLGILTAKKLGYSVYEFKRILRALRKQIDVVETHMSAKEWDKIKYPEVPSRAMLIYRKAFERNDTARYNQFITKAVKGEVKIHSEALFPYDITQKLITPAMHDHYRMDNSELAALEAQWRQLPNYVEAGTNALVISDLSGSMTCNGGLPMASSIGLAIYFADRNVGPYQDIFIPFSTDAHVAQIKGDTLLQKMQCVYKAGNNYCGSTNLKAAFDKVLEIAVSNHVPKDQMVKSLIVISDMEIDAATTVWGHRTDCWSFYEDMRQMYIDAGYDIPNVVFWQVNARHDVFHADATRKGVQLVSGQSAATFKHLLSVVGMTPHEAMMKIIDSDRYSAIRVA